jgi:hypothetical protein
MTKQKLELKIFCEFTFVYHNFKSSFFNNTNNFVMIYNSFILSIYKFIQFDRKILIFFLQYFSMSFLRISKFDMITLQYLFKWRMIFSEWNIFPIYSLKKWMFFEFF